VSMDDRDAYDLTSAYNFISRKPDGWMPRKMRDIAYREAGVRRRKVKGARNYKSPWWLKYDAYIHSPGWRVFRLGVFAMRGAKCERCGRTQGRLDLHHLNYHRLGRERAEDIQILCHDCHKKAHSHKMF